MLQYPKGPLKPAPTGGLFSNCCNKGPGRKYTSSSARMRYRRWGKWRCAQCSIDIASKEFKKRILAIPPITKKWLKIKNKFNDQGIKGCTPTKVPLWVKKGEYLWVKKSPRIPKKSPAKYHGAHTYVAGVHSGKLTLMENGSNGPGIESMYFLLKMAFKVTAS